MLENLLERDTENRLLKAREPQTDGSDSWVVKRAEDEVCRAMLSIALGHNENTEKS